VSTDLRFRPPSRLYPNEVAAPACRLRIFVCGAGDEMWYRVGADLVVVIHLLFIGFVVGGAFLTWRWPWIACAHIPAVIYGALVEFAGFTCPLTVFGERPAVERGGGGLQRRLHRSLSDPGDLSPRAHPWHANRAGCLGAAGGICRILETGASPWLASHIASASAERRPIWAHRCRQLSSMLRLWRRQCPLWRAPAHPSPSGPHRPVPAR
jgi:hypothetical protein